MEPPELQVSNMSKVDNTPVGLFEVVVQGNESEDQKEAEDCNSEWLSTSQSVIQMLEDEDSFDDENYLDEEEHTPEKEIIQGNIQDLNGMDYFQTDNASMHLNSEGKILAHNFGKFSGDQEKHELCGEAIIKNVTEGILETEVVQENRPESSLVQMLWRQIESLALREREVEQALSKERIESLVSKVEEEVEFEGIVEDMCLRFRAEGEFMDMERRERDWERERREVRLEEEVELLRSKVESLQEEIRVANANKDSKLCMKDPKVCDSLPYMQSLSQLETSNAFQKNDTTYQGMPNVGGENVLENLREMLSLAEEKAEQDRRILEDILHDERQLWISYRQQLDSQKHSLEMELKSMNTILKEKESVLTSERERRRQYGIEVDKVLAFWREENAVYNAVCQRLTTIEDFLPEFLQKLMPFMISLESKDDLSEMFEKLSNIVNEKLDLSSPSKGWQQLEWELVESWKAQRDQLEGERDILKELLEEATSAAKENEKKVEILQQDKEKNFMQKQRILDAHIVNGDLPRNQSNQASLSDRDMLEIHASAYKNAWLEERQKVLELIAEREQSIEEHRQEWAALLDEKDEELVFLRSVHQKLESSLSKIKKRLLNLKKKLIRHNSEILEEHVLKEQNSNSNSNYNGGSCNAGNDLGLNTCTDLVTLNEITGEDVYGHACYVDVEQLAKDISKEIGRFSRELCREQDSLERERTDIRIGTEQLKEERRELEKKVADTLIIMEELKEKIREKEGQLEWERKQMDSILASRRDEEENLKQQLNSRELEIKMIMQKFKDEISDIQNKVEKERKEKEEAIEIHSASRRKLMEETKEREINWEREMESLLQQMQGLRVEIDEKKRQILRLENELKEFQEGTAHDKEMKQEELPFGDSLHAESTQEDEDNLTAECCMDDLNSKNMANAVLMNFVRSDAEWQDVIGKIAGFDEQIAEAMLAIQSLREELDVKEKELQRARLERDADKETTWIQEQSQSLELYKNRSIDVPHGLVYGQQEHIYLGDNEDLIKLLEAERADTDDAVSILQGAVRELQWALYDYKSKDGEASTLDMDKEPHNLSTNGELVKVHASHLEDLDRSIIELKLKAEEAEKRARNAEIALAVNAVKESTKCTEPTSALVKFGKDWIDNEVLGRDVVRGDVGSQRFSSSRRKVSEIERKDTDITSTTLRTLQQEQRWSGGSPEHFQLWDMNAGGSFGAGTDVTSNGSSSAWMMVRGCTEDSFAIQDASQQGPLTLAVSNPPRSQRRWLVDGLWLENVRKEQTLMRQQLELERQRVSELKQVEVESRWMEATIMRALEQKKESDTRVLELERKVVFLENMITQKGSHEVQTFPNNFT